MADALLAERRHRFNQRLSQRKRANFPHLGHYDSWLVDHVQQLVQRNHEILLYPGWPNASDVAPTDERFGVVPLRNAALGAAIIEQAKNVPSTVATKLSPDAKFLMRAMKTELPLLPVTTKSEETPFCKMVLDYSDGQRDVDYMAVKWAGKVDCKTVFPKLPFPLSTHHTKWLRNQSIKTALEEAAPYRAKMAELNRVTEPPSSPNRSFGIIGSATVAAAAGGGGSSSSSGGVPVPSAFSVKAQVPIPPHGHPVTHVEQAAVGTLMVGGAASTLPASESLSGPKGSRKGKKDLQPGGRSGPASKCRQPGCPGSNGMDPCRQGAD